MNNAMTAVEDFIYKYDGDQRAIMLYLHQLFVEEFNLTPKLTYNLPFYYRKSWICYLFPTKKGTIELAFTRGNELSNEQGLLKIKGRKQVSSVDFIKLENIPEDTIREVLHEAILLDKNVPYAPKRKE
jgi:hypothetical protein